MHGNSIVALSTRIKYAKIVFVSLNFNLCRCLEIKKGILTLFICYIINNSKKDSIILQVQYDCVMQVIICNLKNTHSFSNFFITTRQVFLNFENTPKSTGY